MEDLKRIENGERAKPTFSAAEYERRRAALRQAMEEAGADCALLTSIHNINYYSDFLYCGFGRPYGLAVRADGGIDTISANIDGGQPWRRTVAGGNIVYTDWQRDNFYRAVRQALPGRGTLGVEFDHLTMDAAEKLRAALPDFRLADLSGATMRLRMIKSDEEIAHIRQGAEVCDIGGAALREAVSEGVPEYEAAMASTQAMVREIARRAPHAELMDTWTWLQSGVNTDGAHNPLTSRRIQRGDILSLNCFAMNAGYYTALERTMFFDHASDDALKLWEINLEVHRAGLDLIRPGARCCDIASVLNEIYESHGLLHRRTFGYGHSFGVLCHYYGREAGLELREDVETEIVPGMVVSMEPMIMIPEGEPGAGGYREHDILVVGEAGAENITGFPLGPEHNIIRNKSP